MDFRNYVIENFIEILRRSTVLEGYMFSKLDTKEILDKGYNHYLDAKQVDEVLNLKHAWSWVLEEHEYNPMILEDLHEIVSSGVTVNPNLEGWFRPADYIVRISGTSYVPPTASRVDALNEFGEKLSILVNRVNGSNSKEGKIRLILSFYLYLMKGSFFMIATSELLTYLLIFCLRMQILVFSCIYLNYLLRGIFKETKEIL